MAELPLPHVNNKDDDKLLHWIRNLWKIGSKCEVYSNSLKKWFIGTVKRVFTDSKGEWLEIQYTVQKIKKSKESIRADCHTIRPLTKAMPIYKYIYNAIRPSSDSKTNAQNKHERMETIYLLIMGLSGRRPIPKDIMLLITEYYTILYDLPINIFLVQNYLNKRKKMEIFNIPKGELLKHATISSKNIYIPPDTSSSKSTMGSKCIINHDTLPISIENICKNDGDDKYKVSKKLIESDKWSMIIKIGHCCHINAFHRDLLIENTEYNRYTFKLPIFSVSYYATMVYNKSNKILYALNAQCGNYGNKRIYSLNFKDDDWKWNTLSSGVVKKRQNTTGCMVDNDKYIAILGGHQYFEPLQYVELYDVNKNQVKRLHDMVHQRKNAVSKYHQIFNKIIIADRHYKSNFRSKRSHGSIEWLDIQKNKWTIIDIDDVSNGWGDLRDIYISYWNPNILQLIGYQSNKILMYGIDTRQSKKNNFINISDKYQYNVLDEEFCTLSL